MVVFFRTPGAARRFPQILERIRSGELHISGLRLLVPHLTEENCGELLDLARHQSKRAIEERLADRAPKPDARAVLRQLPERVVVLKPIVLDSSAAPAVGPIPALSPIAASARPSTEPLGGSRYKVQFTAGPETHAKSREAQALLRHQIPDGDLGRIFDRALGALLRGVRRVKFAETQRPRAQCAEVSGPAPHTCRASGVTANRRSLAPGRVAGNERRRESGTRALRARSVILRSRSTIAGAESSTGAPRSTTLRRRGCTSSLSVAC